MRGFSTHYIKSSTNSAKLRNQLVKCRSKKEYFDIFMNTLEFIMNY